MTPTVSRQRGKYLILLGIVISGALLYVAMRGMSIDKLTESLANSRPWPWLPLGMASYLIGHWVRGLRLKALVSREADMPLTTSTNVVVLGYAVNNILPFRLGELARMGMLYERTGIPFLQSASVTVLERVMDGLTIVAMLAVSVFFVAMDPSMLDLLGKAGVIFGAAFVGVLLLVLRPRWVLGMTARLGGMLLPKKQDALLRMAANVSSGVAYLRRPGDAAVVTILSVLVWIFEAGMFWALMPAIGIEPDPLLAVMAMAVTNLGILVPSTPGYIGVFHYMCMEAVMLVGVVKSTALAYAALVHLTFYVPITLWGVGVILWYGVKLSATIALARAAESGKDAITFGPFKAVVIGRVKAVETRGEATAFTRALIEATLPADFDAVDGNERAALQAEVANFVQGEIDSLPVKLRLLYRLGMTGFQTYCLGRYLGGFASLSLEKRRRAVNAWAFGPISLTRKLMKLVRSTALLIYYEDPRVIAKLDRSYDGAVAGEERP